MRFAHIGDCHLGGWRQPELLALNFQSFQHAIAECIKQNVDFILVAGDLFDSPYPPIEVIKGAFQEFRKVHEAKIPVFIIAGSHDYSVSGKTFLDVLEKAGFVTNVFRAEERNNALVLQPTIYKNVAIYGYPGKKSGLEVDEIKKIKLNESPGLFTILMLHTSIRDAVGNLPMPAVDHEQLPRVDYLALSHLHIKYQRQNRAYSGPTFPNNSQELEELQEGSFYIVDTNGKMERQIIKMKNVVILEIELTSGLSATEEIIRKMSETFCKDAIVILKLKGTIMQGKTADIRFDEIEAQAKKQGAYVLLRNTSALHARETELFVEHASEKLEETIINKYLEEHPLPISKKIPQLMAALQLEKKEDEKIQVYEERILSEVKTIIGL